MARARHRPHLYLDTNVILDVIDSRRSASRTLVERIRSERWPCSTSRFTVQELLDVKQEDAFVEKMVKRGHRLSQMRRLLPARRAGKFKLTQRELDAVYSDLTTALSEDFGFISFLLPFSRLWDEAEKLCADASIDPSDAIHLATAISVGCDVLVTSDTDLIGIAKSYMPVVTPDRAIRTLRDRGFKIS